MAEASSQMTAETVAATIPAVTTLDRVARPTAWRRATIYRQLVVLVLLAVAVAIGTGVVLWTQTPDRVPLYSNLDFADSSKIAEALADMDINYSLDERTGAVLVPKEKLSILRMKLSALGLPENNSASKGLEILQEEQSLSTSQFVQQARYKSALETELARSITSLRHVKSARVHLALPKQSVFVRKRVQPSASVVVQLNGGRRLPAEQVAAITHIVSSSIPNLENGQVTVVDHLGSLLTEKGGSYDLRLSSKELNYTGRIEENYSQRVLRLLEPIVGFGRVRAQVTAELDFTQEESTTEKYDPNEKAIRSEQLSAQKNQLNGIAGVPGALSNQPPGVGTTEAASAAGEESSTPQSESQNTTRNYELDRVISHVRRPYGVIERLSIAVIIDDKIVTGGNVVPGTAGTAVEEKSAEKEVAEGTVESTVAIKREPYTEAEITRITQLVKETIGFKEARGDTVLVLNSSFITPEIEVIPELEIWEEAWVQMLIKQVLTGIFVLLLLLLVVRPIVRSLIPPAGESEEGEEGEEELDENGNPLRARLVQEAVPEVGEAKLIKGTFGKAVQVEGDPQYLIYEDKMEYARMLVEEDPNRTANLLKKWMAEG